VSSGLGTLLLVAVHVLFLAFPCWAREWFVSAGGDRPGARKSPFGRVQEAIEAAQPGDTITIGPGTYTESLRTVRDGAANARITIRSEKGRGSVVVTNAGRVFTVFNAFITVEGLVLDGQYGPDDLLKIGTAADNFTLRDVEVRQSGRDAIDMASPANVLIDHCLIHHALDSRGSRRDAHGIVASAARHLVIRDTEIHTFSGDGIQLDPDRAPPGWSDVVVERCRIWLAPLDRPANGFPAGAVPGENAVDTKASPQFARASMMIRDTEAWGFEHGLISNMAAFNLKENVDVVVDRVTVRDSEIAFRLRGASTLRGPGATVRIQNALIHHVGTAFRYEDDVRGLRIWNSTIGSGVAQIFRAAGARDSRPDVRNLLVLGTGLPLEAAGQSNRAVGASSFVDAARNDYRLSAGSPAIDAGTTIADVAVDRLSVRRPQGRAYDIGAYERPVKN
jgi:hypothetical protein